MNKRCIAIVFELLLCFNIVSGGREELLRRSFDQPASAKIAIVLLRGYLRALFGEPLS